VRRVLRAPFPWFGGKFHASPLVWRAFGKVPNYVEPFAGSLAVLLARPHVAKVETVNDKDGLIANFWRATTLAPDEVARWSDWPVNEADLHARHRWLVEQALPLTEKLVADPDFFDAKIAGWWVWGICSWIGGGWCSPDVTIRSAANLDRRRPELADARGRGVLARQVPQLGTPGNGIHAPGRKKPRTATSYGIHRRSAPVDFFQQLAARLRNVRVCCGDWTRVLGRSTLGIDTNHGMTPCGVLLDPPYAHELREKRMYREDDADLSAAVRAWAIENGENPAVRIALCGFIDEHEMPSTWTCATWKSNGSGKNRTKERIWFSPHCLPVVGQTDLFPAGTEYSSEAST
jgi:DNA adenine methylase